MIGIITYVPALAERILVQFAVIRDGAPPDYTASVCDVDSVTALLARITQTIAPGAPAAAPPTLTTLDDGEPTAKLDLSIE